MRVPVQMITSSGLLNSLDDRVAEQLSLAAQLPGIAKAVIALPDVEVGQGFPVGAVAAFDPHTGVIMAAGVGLDIGCGVRTLMTSLQIEDISHCKLQLGKALFHSIPAGRMGSRLLSLEGPGISAMLRGGARWAIEQGYGRPDDLSSIEEGGHLSGAEPGEISHEARARQRHAMGTLGSGNHYLEVQQISRIFDASIAQAFGLKLGQVLISIHAGARGLSYQMVTEFVREMMLRADRLGIRLSDKSLACAPITSPLGERFFGAVNAAGNCAFANRQMLTHLVRGIFSELFPGETLPLLYDQRHNSCHFEDHELLGASRRLLVHRRGACRALPPGHKKLSAPHQATGHPLFMSGAMGAPSYIMCGCSNNDQLSFNSASHGSPRAISRLNARQTLSGHSVEQALAQQGTLIFSQSIWSIAEQAPEAFRNIDQIALVNEQAGLARRVAQVKPLICLKG